MTLLYAIVATGLGTALWGFGKVDSSFAANACKGIAIEFLLVSAFTAVFVMFSMLIRQNGGAIAANIFFLEFISLIVMFGEMIINKIFDTSITLSNYLIDTNMTQIATSDITGKLAARSICVAFGFFIVATAIGLVSFRKRDIK